MATSVNEIIQKYIELRDRKAEIAKRHEAELAPLSQAQTDIENYLMHQMNGLGVTQLKAEGIGTVFKATSTSCQMADPIAFKEFVFTPAVNGIIGYLQATGYPIGNADGNAIANIIRDMTMWGVVDFRAGKKGITEYVIDEQKPVPGVNINSVATVNVRRA